MTKEFDILIHTGGYAIHRPAKEEPMHKYTEYKVECISEGALGTLLLGASKIPVKKLEARLNELVKDGWQVVFKVVEQKRMLLFWTRETVLVTLGR